mgnify:CR=1 FL=1
MELAEDVVVMTVTNLMNKNQFLAFFVNIWRFDRKREIANFGKKTWRTVKELMFQDFAYLIHLLYYVCIEDMYE